VPDISRAPLSWSIGVTLRVFPPLLKNPERQWSQVQSVTRPPAGYQELRDVVVDVLTRKASVEHYPEQWMGLHDAVAEVLRKGHAPGMHYVDRSRLYPQEAELLRDVFWDLFRQGFITLGLNDNNPTWPWFRLSHTGTKELHAQAPYRFHDATSFFRLLQAETPCMDQRTKVYLTEAVAAYYADCPLACTVMLGVAAESEFLHLADMAANHQTHGPRFQKMTQQRTVSQKMDKFRESIKALTLPQNIAESFETHFSAIQTIIRLARNDSGHPTGVVPSREAVYVYMQLFVPYASLIAQLRQFFA
jgi:hypothetical protein